MQLEYEQPRSGLSEPELEARFDSLQQHLVELWQSVEGTSHETETVVVLPSLSVDYPALTGATIRAYEERFLCLLLLLKRPGTRVIYITSSPIEPGIIGYYLGLIQASAPVAPARRCFFFTAHDGTSLPLSAKLLRRPGLLERIRAAIPDPRRAHLVPFNTTRLERDVALHLGIPMFAPNPSFGELGTKSGCRKLFREANVPCPLGAEDLRDEQDVVSALVDLTSRKPDLAQAILKLNDGVSGDGNALIELTGAAGDPRRLYERTRSLCLEASGRSREQFFEKLRVIGGTVEERVSGAAITSPSVQLRITPLGDLELVSAHDQLLGGRGQKYVGCVFPPSDSYASMICRLARRAGELLARRGVLGRFSIDFVCAREQDAWHPYAIEINLRKGGTTHPFLTLQLLTEGRYDPSSNRYVAEGVTKHYLASDDLHHEAFRSLIPEDLVEVARTNRLDFDGRSGTGIVLHMLSDIGEHGRFGLTAIHDSRAAAHDLYHRAEGVFHAAADRAARPLPLP
jgi:hypothetical protein